MKKSSAVSILHFIISLLLISIFIASAASCSPATTGPINTITSSLSQSSVKDNSSPAMSEAPAPADTPSIEQWKAATTVTAKELGISDINGSYFYWSPDANHAIFIGAMKDDKNKYTQNVYLYSVQDKKITKIIDGVYDVNCFLSEPEWSADGTLATIPFYNLDMEEYPVCIYDILKGKLDILPVKGTFPSISPDKSKVSYLNNDNVLCLFNLSDRTTTVLPGKISGCDFIWFSDSARILFKKFTENSLSKMETEASRTDICIVDTKKPGNIQSLGHESIPGKLTWIIQDELVWDWKRGEGEFYAVLDLQANKYTNFEEFLGVFYQTRSNEAAYILIDKEKDYRPGFHSLGRDMKELGKYLAEIMESKGIALSLLPDGNLLYVSSKASEKKKTIMVSYKNEKKFAPLSTFEGDYIINRSNNGSRVALILQDGEKMILIDTAKISIP